MAAVPITLPTMRCQYFNSENKICGKQSVYRIHLGPFNHLDLCLEHYNEYKEFIWVEELSHNYVM